MTWIGDPAWMQELTPRVVERFLAKVERRGPEECWPWKNNNGTNPYGSFYISTRYKRQPHRVAYVIAYGDPGELVVDHLCGRPGCCNPAHLEAVTQQENVRRGKIGRRTHCPQGHPLDMVVDKGGGRLARACRTCKNARARRAHARRKAARTHG